MKSEYRVGSVGTAPGCCRVSVHAALTTRYSRLAMRRQASGFTLIEILIAIFVFLIGILGVLSMFPVAMHSASRAVGEVRGNILSQSVLSQLTADCRVPYVQGTITANIAGDQIALALDAPYGNCADGEWDDYFVSIPLGSPYALPQGHSRRIDTTVQAVIVPEVTFNGSTSGVTLTDLTKGWAVDEHVGRWVVLTSGLESGECRLITANTADTLTLDSVFDTDPMGGLNYDIKETQLTVASNWNPAPAAGTERFVITRMGLPDLPVYPGTPAEVGLERDFYVRQIIDENTIEIGRRDTVEPTDGVVTAHTVGSLTDDTKSWTDDIYIGCTVLLTSGTGAGQQRLITDNDATTLTISTNWDLNPDNDETEYEILSINPLKYYSGTVSLPGAAAGTLDLYDDDDAVTWDPNVLADHLVRITDGAGAGQVRRIRSNEGERLTVTSPWKEALDITSTYEIGWPDATLTEVAGEPVGFLVITSGRARGRVYKINASTADAVNGHRISCSGADLDFRELGVTGARVPLQKSATEYPNNDDYKYKPSDSTTVTIIGNSGYVRSVLPVAQDRTLRIGEAIPRDDDINVFGDDTKTQTLYDVYGSDTDGDSYGEYGSEYSAVAVFSDSGTLLQGPVRVDVLVFRNYDSSKDPADNRKPVGFLTGYIGRP